MPFDPQTVTTTTGSPPTPNLISTVGALLVQIVAVAGIVVLAALKVISGDAAIGVVGAVVGIHGTVAAANLTPNP